MLKQAKLRHKLTFIQMIVVIIVAVAYLLTFQIFTYLYNQQVCGNIEQLLSVLSDNVERNVGMAREIAAKVASDSFIREQMKVLEGQGMNYNKIKQIDRIKESVNRLTITNSYIAGALVMDRTSVTEVMTGSFELPEEISPKNLVAEMAVYDGGTKMLYFASMPNMVYIGCNIRESYNSRSESLGVIVLQMDMSSLLYFSTNLSQNSMIHMLILDGERLVYRDERFADFPAETIIKNAQSRYQFTDFQGNKYMALVRLTATTNWKYIILEEYSALFNGLERFNLLIYAILFSVLVITTIVYIVLTKKTTLSIERFAKKMRTSVGEFAGKTDESENNNNEILIMSNDLDSLVAQLEKMMREDYNKQLTIKEFEYKMLQMQISPHFLYNTLQSVSVMAKMGQSARIPVVIKKLSNLLRAAINTNTMLFTVDEEVSVLCDYVDIQTERFGKRLQFHIENSIYDYSDVLIPKMTLQPLVENCIRHVLEKIPCECVISLGARANGSAVILSLKDNGVGVSPSRIASILRGEVGQKKQNVGLYNIHKRLQNYFGDEYGLKIYNRPVGGTCVEVRIPISYRGEEAEREEGSDC